MRESNGPSTLSPLDLNESKLTGWKWYRSLDPVLCELFLKYVRSVGFTSDSRLNRICELFKGFENFAWRAESTRYLGPTHELAGMWVFHQGIHSLVARRFGHRLRGRPKLTLLNEALGVGWNAYWSSLALLKGFPPTEDCLPTFVKSADALQVPLKPVLERALEDPFDIYRQITIENFELYCILFQDLGRGEDITTAVLNRWKGEIVSRETSPFFVHYSLARPPQYAAIYCGFESDEGDRERVGECLEILNDSVDFPDFATKLGIGSLDAT